MSRRSLEKDMPGCLTPAFLRQSLLLLFYMQGHKVNAPALLSFREGVQSFSAGIYLSSFIYLTLTWKRKVKIQRHVKKRCTLSHTSFLAKLCLTTPTIFHYQMQVKRQLPLHVKNGFEQKFYTGIL